MERRACGRLLIVDDARPLRGYLRDALIARYPGLLVIEAGGVGEGYRLARELRPELVLLDIRLPDGNGLDLARRIRAEIPEAALCICTGNDYPEYRQAAAEAGACHFISKQDRYLREVERVVKSVFRMENSHRLVLEEEVLPAPQASR